LYCSSGSSWRYLKILRGSPAPAGLSPHVPASGQCRARARTACVAIKSSHFFGRKYSPRRKAAGSLRCRSPRSMIEGKRTLFAINRHGEISAITSRKSGSAWSEPIRPFARQSTGWTNLPRQPSHDNRPRHQHGSAGAQLVPDRPLDPRTMARHLLSHIKAFATTDPARPLWPTSSTISCIPRRGTTNDYREHHRQRIDPGHTAP